MNIWRTKSKPRNNKAKAETPDTSGEYLSARGAWTLVKIGRANFYKRVRNGQLPPARIRIGRLTRWSRAELLAAVSNHSK